MKRYSLNSRINWFVGQLRPYKVSWPNLEDGGGEVEVLENVSWPLDTHDNCLCLALPHPHPPICHFPPPPPPGSNLLPLLLPLYFPSISLLFLYPPTSLSPFSSLFPPIQLLCMYKTLTPPLPLPQLMPLTTTPGNQKSPWTDHWTE